MTEPTRLEELIKLLDTKQAKRDTLESARVEAYRQRDSLDEEMQSLDDELRGLRKGRVLITDRIPKQTRTYYYIDSIGGVEDKYGYSRGMAAIGNLFYDRESALEAHATLIEQYKAKES